VGLAKAPVLWGENASAPLTAAMSRASAGAVEHAQLCKVSSLTNALTHAVSLGFTVVGLDSHAPTSLGAVDLSGPSIIVVGGEGKGLGKQVRRSCTHLATLVQPHTIDSLNASVAAALALYEACRQRQGATSAFAAAPGDSIEET
jgi:23S rRNA (guanosine2251-2'-O)-methyltransferase